MNKSTCCGDYLVFIFCLISYDHFFAWNHFFERTDLGSSIKFNLWLINIKKFHPLTSFAILFASRCLQDNIFDIIRLHSLIFCWRYLHNMFVAWDTRIYFDWTRIDLTLAGKFGQRLIFWRPTSSSLPPRPMSPYSARTCYAIPPRPGFEVIFVEN